MENTLKYRRVNLKVSHQIYDYLTQQSDLKGMNLSAYISHLIIMEQERIKANERMEKLFTQMFPNGVNDIGKLAKLMKEVDKGDES
jgi:uncharacterized protein (DUF1778 family)